MKTITRLGCDTRAFGARTLFLALVFGFFGAVIRAQDANIPIYPITTVNTTAGTGYFSDPYHVPYANASNIYFAGTTPEYLVCGSTLQAQCATQTPADTYTTDQDLLNQIAADGAQICSSAGLHPYQRNDGSNAWDAIVTLHLTKQSAQCSGITGWSVILHAQPATSGTATPPTSWVGDTLLIGSFSTAADANYDGKYFQVPGGSLYLVYSAELSTSPHEDGIVAQLMTSPTAVSSGAPTVLLGPDANFNSENYNSISDSSFKLIETGNIRAINGKFVMAYSAGAYDLDTYKIGIAYSDTFLPAAGQQYRKVLKNNPNDYWNSPGTQEVYYLLQSQVAATGWHYEQGEVLAPGVPTVAELGSGGSWVLTFAGYDPGDAPQAAGSNKYEADHRRPYFINIKMNVPSAGTVANASDTDLQGWITPVH